jgi:hypothetical protein
MEPVTSGSVTRHSDRLTTEAVNIAVYDVLPAKMYTNYLVLWLNMARDGVVVRYREAIVLWPA